jgi:hypothetical protein
MRSIIKVDEREIRVTGRLIKAARLEGDKYQFLEKPETMIEGLRKCGNRVDLFTFIQRLPETAPKYSYPMEWDNFAALRVSTFEHWWNKQLGFKARNKAKQAEKRGVVVREVPFDDTLVRGIHEVYNESPIRQGIPNAHYGKDIEAIFRMTSTFPDSSIFIGAFLDDALIGFVKLVQDETRTQAGLMNIVSMNRHRDKAPTNALIAQAVRSCAERGISYLVYSNFAYGKKQHSSLGDFKERNGFQRIDVPRYYVPLTRTGWVAFQLGLHRKLIDYIPESLGAKLREIRAAWYKRKFQSLTEPS